MIISTINALKAMDLYPQTVVAGDLLFVSACRPFLPVDGAVSSENISEQSKQALDNLQILVASVVYLNNS